MDQGQLYGLLESAKNITDGLSANIFQNAIYGILATATVASATWAWKTRAENIALKNSLDALEEQYVHSDEIVGSLTLYTKTTANNAKTGEPIYRQDLATISESRLQDIVPDNWHEFVAKNLDSARQACTDENPSVLYHLAQMHRNPTRALDALNSSIINEISKKINSETVMGALHRLDGDEDMEPDTKDYYAVLIDEPTAPKRQMRIIVVPYETLSRDRPLPDEDHVVFGTKRRDENTGKRLYSDCPDTNHPQRYETMKTLKNLYGEKPELFAPIDHYTGGIRPITNVALADTSTIELD